MKNIKNRLDKVKSIKIKKPHWQWPPMSNMKISSIKKYYEDGELKNKNGYPKSVENFEKNFAKYQKKKFALTFNSGTSSLHAAFFAAGLKKGDEIISSSLTFHATTTPVMSLGLKPIFADSDFDTGNISPKSILKKITKKTKAIVITHLCGHPCEMDEILKIVKKYKLKLIEDCSHAHGSKYKGKKVGNFGDIGCFSLDNNKLLAAGEGGVLVTDKREYYEKAMLFSDFGSRVQNQIKLNKFKKYVDTGLGFKHRIHPVSAAIANAALEKIDFYIKKRHKTLSYFSKNLEKIDGLSPPITRNKCFRGAYFGYRPFYDKKKFSNTKIEKFISILQSKGLEVRLAGNKPLHMLNIFKIDKSNTKKLPMSEKFYFSTLSFPTFTFEKKFLIDEYLRVLKEVSFALQKK